MSYLQEILAAPSMGNLRIPENTDEPMALQPLDVIHARVRWLFTLLTVLTVLILVTMGFRLVNRAEKLSYLDVGWMSLFAIATTALTMAEIGCLRYIRHRVRPQLASLVLRDELTGLFNRRYMNDRVDEEICRCRRHQRQCSIVYIDLDGFKQVNDRHGHEAGNAVLVQVARWLEKSLRREDVVARVGGDEFLLLLSETKPSEAANLLIRLHTKFMEESYHLPNGAVLPPLKFSMGVAAFPSDGETRDRLVSEADTNMYRHKARQQ